MWWAFPAFRAVTEQQHIQGFCAEITLDQRHAKQGRGGVLVGN